MTASLGLAFLRVLLATLLPGVLRVVFFVAFRRVRPDVFLVAFLVTFLVAFFAPFFAAFFDIFLVIFRFVLLAVFFAAVFLLTFFAMRLVTFLPARFDTPGLAFLRVADLVDFFLVAMVNLCTMIGLHKCKK